MHAVILAVALFVPSECPQCQNGRGAASRTHSDRPAMSALNCPHSTPPVRCYHKPCAGCAGGVCLSCQAPYYGSAPYNYRIAFDYPWSQRPAFPIQTELAPNWESEDAVPGEVISEEPIPLTSQKSRLRR